MDDLQLFRLLGSGGYYPHREKSGNADHLYDVTTGNCLLYTNLVGMKSSIVVEINQVRVGIIDPISQTTAYLHADDLACGDHQTSSHDVELDSQQHDSY